MDTSVNAANQVVSVGADIAFDADPKFFACLVRFESSSVPTKTQSEPKDRRRFSRNAETDLVCRLLLEKKKTFNHTAQGNYRINPHNTIQDTPPCCDATSMRI